MRDLCDNYVNGNLSYGGDKLPKSDILLGDLFEFYVNDYNPSTEDMILFIHRLGD